MKRRKWPVDDASNQTVFDGIVVNVMKMILEIAFVSDEVFPESLLPD